MKTTEPSRKLYVTVPTSGTDKMERDRKALTTAITKLIQRFGFEDILQCMSSNSHLALEGPNGKASTRKPTKKATPAAASHEEEKAVTVRIEGGGRRATWLVDLSKPHGHGTIEKAIASAGWEVEEVIGQTLPTYKPTELGLVRYFLLKRTVGRAATFVVLRYRQHPVAGGVSLTYKSAKVLNRLAGSVAKVESALNDIAEIETRAPQHQLVHNEATRALFESLRKTNPLSSKNGQKAVPWKNGLGGRHMGSDRNYR